MAGATRSRCSDAFLPHVASELRVAVAQFVWLQQAGCDANERPETGCDLQHGLDPHKPAPLDSGKRPLIETIAMTAKRRRITAANDSRAVMISSWRFVNFFDARVGCWPLFLQARRHRF